MRSARHLVTEIDTPPKSSVEKMKLYTTAEVKKRVSFLGRRTINKNSVSEHMIQGPALTLAE